MRILYHFPLSPYARKIRLILSERRLSFELKTEKVWERRPDYLALNPAGTVPTLVDEDGTVVPDSGVICEYLEDVYADTPMLGRNTRERIEVRRLLAWFDGKFAHDVTRNLYGEKLQKRLAGSGHPDPMAMRLGYANLKAHMEYLAWLAETRAYLAGNEISAADFAAAAHLSTLDYAGEIDWPAFPVVRDWYARLKSRPSFRPLLADRIAGATPPEHYSNLDF
jgi:glutathione S-transferase